MTTCSPAGIFKDKKKSAEATQRLSARLATDKVERNLSGSFHCGNTENSGATWKRARFSMFPPAPCRTRAGLKQRTASCASSSPVRTLREPTPTPSEHWFTSCAPRKTHLGRALGPELSRWLSSASAKAKVGLAGEELRSQRRHSPAACRLPSAPNAGWSAVGLDRDELLARLQLHKSCESFFFFFFYLFAKNKNYKTKTKAASPKITEPTKCRRRLFRRAPVSATTRSATSGHDK